MIYTDFDLTLYNSYRVRSIASLALFPSSREELLDYVERYPKFVVLGGGNNIILSRPYYDIPFLFLSKMSNCYCDENAIIVDSGLPMSQFSDISATHGFSGVEVFYDIPGCIGGGIFMNAGAGEQFISDFIESVEVLDIRSMQISQILKSDSSFCYRNSIFKSKNNLIILGATFSFTALDDEYSIRERMNNIKSTRWQKQPREYPNAGSVFKRPEGHFVGPMIQELGLKGFSIGGAAVSEKHAGFIINKGNATGIDILSLIEYIRKKVFKYYSIELELEQIVI